MEALLVVDQPKRLTFDIPGVEVVSARAYLTDKGLAARRNIKVFNLCKSYRYQSTGYYVSLLATARGHKPVPSIRTIQELKANEIVRIRSDELDDLIQKSFAPIGSESFTLSIYFGRNLAERHNRLSRHLFKLFHAPFLRATFSRQPKTQVWQLVSISPIAAKDIPDSHHDFVREVATEYFRTGKWNQPRPRVTAYDLAILFDPTDIEPPSDERAIKKFMKAALDLGMSPYLVSKDDYAELAEFDALFIRETTNVNHHTYRFARRAAAEGLVVIDDPESILRCTNKVYLAELLEKHNIATPKSLIVHKDNLSQVAIELGFPCILKQPDSAFSQGVVKAKNEAELIAEGERLLAKSELVIAQEYVPTEYDWRVGIIDGEPLYVCKYYMAPKHWQIVKTLKGGGRRSGRAETMRVEDAPPQVVRVALKAAKLVGDGLYGVDLKQLGRKVVVIEVNDNPSIEAGCEDLSLKDELYKRIMQVFRRRLDAAHGVTEAT